MNLELSNSVAVVIGGARGLGRAIAQALAAEGARLALVDALDEVHRAAADLNGSGHATHSWVADVTDYAAIQEVVARIEAKLGPAEHVFFAVGIGSGKFGFPFWNLEPGDWPKVLTVNLIGAANVAHAFAQSWPPRDAGRCCSSRRSPAKLARRPIRRTAPPKPA